MGAILGLFSGGMTRWLFIGGGALIVLVGGWLYLSGLYARVDAAELRATIAKANEQTALRAGHRQNLGRHVPAGQAHILRVGRVHACLG